MSSKVAVYPGTFDPITHGHLSILTRALKIFDKLVIAILTNPKKVPLFSMEERIAMIKEVLRDQRNVEIDSYNGLLVDYVMSKKSNVIIRGLRALSDFEYEFQMALMNRKLNREVQSVFLMTDYKWFYTSSTIIKEAASLGGDVSGLVPSIVCKKLKEKFKTALNIEKRASGNASLERGLRELSETR
jgi:pantetheine-phosphate adenylyltransferase